jgi:hypothetical protein
MRGGDGKGGLKTHVRVHPRGCTWAPQRGGVGGGVGHVRQVQCRLPCTVRRAGAGAYVPHTSWWGPADPPKHTHCPGPHTRHAGPHCRRRCRPRPDPGRLGWCWALSGSCRLHMDQGRGGREKEWVGVGCTCYWEAALRSPAARGGTQFRANSGWALTSRDTNATPRAKGTSGQLARKQKGFLGKGKVAVTDICFPLRRRRSRAG